MRIGIDIDNVLSNFNEVLLNDYINHDKELGNNGIIKNNVYIRDMFNWTKDEEQQYYHNNIERLANLLEPIKDCSKYIKKLIDNGHYICIISGRDNGEYSDPYNMTTKWLKKYDIPYDKLILTNAYNPQEKAQAEIDIMGEQDKNTALFAECKWTNEKVELSVLETLVKRSELFHYKTKHYYLFSKSGNP